MALSFPLIDKRQPKWLAFVIQAVSVPVAAEVFAFSLIFLGSLVVKSLLATGTFVEGALVAGVGLLLGLIVARIAPSWIPSGRWIWVPAVLFFATALISDLRTLPQYYGGSHWIVIARYFSGTADEGTTPLFATYPVCAAVAYSAAVSLGSRRHS